MSGVFTIKLVLAFMVASVLTLDWNGNGREIRKEKRVIGGSEVAEGDANFVVVIEHKSIPGRALCLGVLYKERYVLTLQSCIVGLRAKDLLASFGDNILENLLEGKVGKIGILRKFSHRKYKEHTDANNIAILVLNCNEIPNNVTVQTVTLFGEKKLESGTEVDVFGWGTTSHSVVETTSLETARLRSVSKEECTQAYGDVIEKSMLCAEEEEKGVHADDSGGPLMLAESVDQNDELILVGLVLWGVGCENPNDLGVYTNIGYFRNWIERKTDKFAEHC